MRIWWSFHGEEDTDEEFGVTTTTVQFNYLGSTSSSGIVRDQIKQES